MLLNESKHESKVFGIVAFALRHPDRCEPDLCVTITGLHVNVRRFGPFVAPEEEPIRPCPLIVGIAQP